MKKLENMTISQAVQLTVETAGGAKQVAEQMGVGHQVLLNKVNPNNKTHHLNLAEAVKMMQVTSDTRILEALANEFGGLYIPIALTSSAAPNLIGDLATMSAEFGALMREVAEDLADGAISDNELADVEREAGNLRTALAVLLADLRRVNKDGHRRRELPADQH
jgi:hypothetical protein